MSEEDSPEVQLATYKEQLGQIEESLSQDPKNGALLRLKAELLDVIKLTQDLLKLKSSSSSSSSSPTSSSSSSRSSGSSSRSSSNGTSTSSSKSSSSSKGGGTTNIGSTNRSKSLILQQQYALTNDNDQAQESAGQLDTSSTFTVGTKCLAKFSEDGIWYEAVIESVPTSDQDKFFVTYTEYGNQEYVTLDNLKVIQGEAKKRKDKPTESEDGLIPKSLKILPTDSEEVRQAKRRRQHAIKSQTRNKKLEEERSGKKSAWQEFTQKSGGKQKASSGPKRESIFRSPDTVEGKVGVTGSGKPLTPSPQFNSTEVAHVKHKLPPPT